MMDDLALRMRRKGHRLGIFLTLFGPLLTIAGLLSGGGTWSTPTWALLMMWGGVFLFVFGYAFARLWYWFKAA